MGGKQVVAGSTAFKFHLVSVAVLQCALDVRKMELFWDENNYNGKVPCSMTCGVKVDVFNYGCLKPV